MTLVPFGSGRLPAVSHPGCFAMAGDGTFQFDSEVRSTLFEQVLVLASAGPIDGRKMSAGGMEAQTKTAKDSCCGPTGFPIDMCTGTLYIPS